MVALSARGAFQEEGSVVLGRRSEASLNCKGNSSHSKVHWGDPDGGMGREAGGGLRMGSACKSMADSCQCAAKTLQYCKVISLQLIKIKEKNKVHSGFCLLLDTPALG